LTGLASPSSAPTTEQGTTRLSGDTVLPIDARAPLRASATGHLQLIDMHASSAKLASDQTRVHRYIRPGDYLVTGQTIGHADGLSADQARDHDKTRLRAITLSALP